MQDDRDIFVIFSGKPTELALKLVDNQGQPADLSGFAAATMALVRSIGGVNLLEEAATIDVANHQIILILDHNQTGVLPVGTYIVLGKLDTYVCDPVYAKVKVAV